MILVLNGLIAILVACSQQGMYKALQKRHEIRCNQVPESDYENCMKEAQKEYEDYSKEREEIIK